MAPPVDNLLAHRGLTHSFFFNVLIGLLLAFLAHRYHQKQNVSPRQWIFFFLLQLFIHISIDTCNAYGVGLLEPFSQQRFSIHTLYVADPFFVLPLGVTCVLLLINRKWLSTRLSKIALILSAAYLMYAFVNKYTVENAIRAEQSYKQLSFFTTPSPFNTWLWFVVVKDSAGYEVGYRSVFDGADRLTAFTHIAQRDDLLTLAKDKEAVRKLVQFADGWYSVELRNDTLLFNIPRFGQVTGWADGSLPFVFHYYVDLPDTENKLVMQRGRFQNWNSETRAALLRRIKGD